MLRKQGESHCEGGPTGTGSSRLDSSGDQQTRGAPRSVAAAVSAVGVGNAQSAAGHVWAVAPEVIICGCQAPQAERQEPLRRGVRACYRSAAERLHAADVLSRTFTFEVHRLLQLRASIPCQTRARVVICLLGTTLSTVRLYPARSRPPFWCQVWYAGSAFRPADNTERGMPRSSADCLEAAVPEALTCTAYGTSQAGS